jgi:hypothetical protein
MSCVRPPASERLVDAACLGFAAWTLACQAMVALGGSLRDLLAVVAGLAALAVAATLRRRRRGARAAFAAPASRAGQTPPALPAAPAEAGTRRGAPPARGLAAPRARRWLRAALALAGAALLFVWRGDPVALWGVAVGVLGAAAALLFAVAPAPRADPPAGGAAREAALWALALACVALTLAAHRDDRDDAFYVNAAAAMADAPAEPLLRDDTLHGVPGLPIHHPAYRLHGFETLAGAVAWATGIPAIAVFHFGFAALGALLVPLAQARLFRLLVPRIWLGAVAALLLVLVAAGDAHRWYGNFAFVRMWQGKAFLLCVFLPLVQAYAIRFGLSPSWRSWLRLFAAQVAALGASSSALWAAPIAAGIGLASAVAPDRRGLRLAALGALASLHVLGAGLVLRHELAVEAAARSALRPAQAAEKAERLAQQAHAPGVQLEQSLYLVMGKGRLRSAAVAASVLAWAVLAPGLAQRFAILAPLAGALLLVPFASRFVAESVTGPSTWRALWVVPVPALLALVLAAPLQLGGRLRGLGRAASAALAAGFALGVPAQSSLDRANGVRLGWPGLKVPPADYALAERLTRSVAPGSRVVAPPRVSFWVPVFPRRAFPLVVMDVYLQRFRPQLGQDDIAQRFVASLVAGGVRANDDAVPLFRLALERYAVKGVLLVDSPDAPALRRILVEAGFRRVERLGSAAIWVRP